MPEQFSEEEIKILLDDISYFMSIEGHRAMVASSSKSYREHDDRLKRLERIYNVLKPMK